MKKGINTKFGVNTIQQHAMSFIESEIMFKILFIITNGVYNVLLKAIMFSYLVPDSVVSIVRK